MQLIYGEEANWASIPVSYSTPANTTPVPLLQVVLAWAVVMYQSVHCSCAAMGIKKCHTFSDVQPRFGGTNTRLRPPSRIPTIVGVTAAGRELASPNLQVHGGSSITYCVWCLMDTMCEHQTSCM